MDQSHSRRARIVFRVLVVLALAGLAYGLAAVFPLQYRPAPQMIVRLLQDAPDVLQVAHGKGRRAELATVPAEADGSFRLDLAKLLQADHGPVILRRAGKHDFALEPGGDGAQRARLVPFPHGWRDSVSVIGIVTLRSYMQQHLIAAAAALLGALAGLACLRSNACRRLEDETLAFLAPFRWWEGALAAAVGALLVARPAGSDLWTFSTLLDLQHMGVNLYQFELQAEVMFHRLAQGGLPAWPYTPLPAALLVPMVELFRLVKTSHVGLPPMVLTIALFHVAAVLAGVHLLARHGVLAAGQVRPAVWFTLANPFLLYHVVIFGQVDIFAVFFFLLGLSLFLGGGGVAAAGLLIGLSTFIKPQHVILLVPLAVFLFYWIDRANWRRVAALSGAIVLGLGLGYGVLLLAQRDFKAVLDATAHKHRIWQIAIVYTHGSYLLTLFFGGAIAFMTAALAWPERHGLRGHLVAMSLMAVLLVGCYQIAILSTPGFYALMLMAVPLIVAAGAGTRRLLLFSAFSAAGTVTWSLTRIGDLSRLAGGSSDYFADRMARMAPRDMENYHALLFSLERAFVAVLMICAVWAAVVLLRRPAAD